MVLTLVFVLVGFSFNGALTDASESKLIFDDPELSTFKAETYHLEGELPIGNTIKIDGTDAEVFRKFRITVPLDKPETYTPVEIVVKDEVGNELENHTHHIENRGEINIKLTQNDPHIEIDGERLNAEVPASNIGGSMIPLEEITEALRGEIFWDESTQISIIKHEGSTITLKVGRNLQLLMDKRYRSVVLFKESKTE
ncbi:MAG: stalk domain-containing protein [Caldisericia bacterium]